MVAAQATGSIGESAQVFAKSPIDDWISACEGQKGERCRALDRQAEQQPHST